MRYSIRKLDSSSKRHVRSKVFPAKVFSSGGSHFDTSLYLTLCDPRTKAGEGMRMDLQIEPSDMTDPVMAAFMGRLYAMMSQEMRDEMFRVASLEAP